MRQTEITGTERPSIAEIDEAIEELLAIQKQIAKLKSREQIARGVVDVRILQHKAGLDKNDDGNATYCFVDGAQIRPFVVHEKTWIRIGKAFSEGEE